MTGADPTSAGKDGFIPTVLAEVAAKLNRMDKLSADRADPETFRLLTAECCWWLASVDEQLGNDDNRAYRSARGSNSAGQTLAGIRFARHAFFHQVAQMASVRPLIGAPGSGYFLFISNPYRWIRWEHLPAGLSDRNPALGRSFEAHLAGRMIVPTIAAAHSFIVAQVTSDGTTHN